MRLALILTLFPQMSSTHELLAHHITYKPMTYKFFDVASVCRGGRSKVLHHCSGACPPVGLVNFSHRTVQELADALVLRMTSSYAEKQNCERKAQELSKLSLSFVESPLKSTLYIWQHAQNNSEYKSIWQLARGRTGARPLSLSQQDRDMYSVT